MSFKNFKVFRFLIAFFLAMTVSIAISTKNVYLAISALAIGSILMLLIKKNVKAVLVDEMVRDIAGRSALMAYSVTVVVLAVLSLVLMLSGLSDEGSYLYNLGLIFSYIALFSMAVYSISYYFYRKKYGANEK